jgi:hypothetical protein
MKKIKFTGVVNGVEYNNLQDYNKAVTEAMELGAVEAYTKTETIDNEPEPVNPNDENCYKFVGVVNGVEYNNLQDYNKAFEEAIKSGYVDAYTKSSKSCECGRDYDCECNDEDCKEAPINYFPGFFETGSEVTSDYIDNNVKNDSNDCNWRDHFQNLSDELSADFKQITNTLPELSSDEKIMYLKDINDILIKISQDDAANTKALKQFQNSLDELLSSMRTCRRATEVIRLYNEFYNELKNKLEPTCEPTNITEVSPQNEVTIDTSVPAQEVVNVVTKFFNSLLGK